VCIQDSNDSEYDSMTGFIKMVMNHGAPQKQGFSLLTMNGKVNAVAESSLVLQNTSRNKATGVHSSNGLLAEFVGAGLFVTRSKVMPHASIVTPLEDSEGQQLCRVD
jgi:hypothetical protein